MNTSKLYATDYVLLKNGQPREALDIIYNQSAVVTLFNEGFKLEDGEEFVSMTALPAELRELYVNNLENKIDRYELAAGFYQSQPLPENHRSMEEEEFYAHLEENAWAPFAHYPGKDIAEFIDGLEMAFDRVAGQ